ncbi:hypothetical protein BGZ94_008174, partial [Podila epigama]
MIRRAAYQQVAIISSNTSTTTATPTTTTIATTSDPRLVASSSSTLPITTTTITPSHLTLYKVPIHLVRRSRAVLVKDLERILPGKSDLVLDQVVTDQGTVLWTRESDPLLEQTVPLTDPCSPTTTATATTTLAMGGRGNRASYIHLPTSSSTADGIDEANDEDDCSSIWYIHVSSTSSSLSPSSSSSSSSHSSSSYSSDNSSSARSPSSSQSIPSVTPQQRPQQQQQQHFHTHQTKSTANIPHATEQLGYSGVRSHNTGDVPCPCSPASSDAHLCSLHGTTTTMTTMKVTTETEGEEGEKEQQEVQEAAEETGAQART